VGSLSLRDARLGGLKLEPVQAPGEFLVVDHVEKPSEN
jgi:uncharacterized protein (TIGR03435 family)